MRGRGRNADHKRLAAARDHVIDTVSVDHDQTAKPVLVLREHRCSWTEALLVQNKGAFLDQSN